MKFEQALGHRDQPCNSVSIGMSYLYSDKYWTERTFEKDFPK